jgi:hypothetical protein
MSAVTGGPRSPEQRSAENARFRAREAGAGIVRMAVAVPVDRIPHLRALLVEWRREAKMLLESDLPTSDQILQIHAVCRTLRIKLPVEVFETRALAEHWLLANQPRLGRRILHVAQSPHKRS